VCPERRVLGLEGLVPAFDAQAVVDGVSLAAAVTADAHRPILRVVLRLDGALSCHVHWGGRRSGLGHSTLGVAARVTSVTYTVSWF
jgi:hypothetical protein